MKLHFPSQQTIVSYLEEHPLTNKKGYPYLSNKKIIEAVAHFFANPDKAQIGIDAGVTLTMSDLQDKLNISHNPLMFIIKCLKHALTDCAHEQQIKLERMCKDQVSKL